MFTKNNYIIPPPPPPPLPPSHTHTHMSYLPAVKTTPLVIGALLKYNAESERILSSVFFSCRARSFLVGGWGYHLGNTLQVDLCYWCRPKGYFHFKRDWLFFPSVHVKRNCSELQGPDLNLWKMRGQDPLNVRAEHSSLFQMFILILSDILCQSYLPAAKTIPSVIEYLLRNEIKSETSLSHVLFVIYISVSFRRLFFNWICTSSLTCHEVALVSRID